MSFHAGLESYYMIPMLLGLMMPAVFAVGFIWSGENRGMRRDFLDRTFNLRLIRPVRFVALLTLMPVSVVAAIGISLLQGGSVGQFHLSESFSFSTGFVPVLALLFLASIFEELGWRGYGFESLEQGMGFAGALVLFGCLWSLWHLPLLWVRHSYQYAIYHQNPWFAVNFFVGTAILGIIVTWVCQLNNRSILATILFHFWVNLSQELFSMTQETKCLQTLVLAGVAGWILLAGRPRLREDAEAGKGTAAWVTSKTGIGFQA